MDRFVFEGFLPKKKGRHTRLSELTGETRTIVIYEAPLRVGKTLADLAEYLGAERRVAICRELTKKFEEVIHGSLGELAERFASETLKGEIVIVVEGETRRQKKREEYETETTTSEDKQVKPDLNFPFPGREDVHKGNRR